MIRIRQVDLGPENRQLFDLTDRGLLLADGVFDTSRVVSGRIIQRRAHLTRLLSDAAALGIEMRLSELEGLAGEAVPDGANGALRLTVTRGPGARGLSGEDADTPTVIARFSPIDTAFPMPPVRLGISQIRRNPTSPTARHKTLSYTDNVIALRAAVSAGFEDALMLSPDGHAACASAANLFALRDNRLVTPPVSDGAMPGIVRAWLLSWAGDAGLEAAEESLTPEHLAEADRVFLTNSLRIFQPVSALSGKDFETELPTRLLELGRFLLEGRFDD